jgi:hypothetical protein
MSKNILFKKPAQRVVATTSERAPICPKSGRPMVKVICGSKGRKRVPAWFSPATKVVLPIFKISKD